MTRMTGKTDHVLATAASMPLAVGAVWRGTQRSGRKSYEVEVRVAGVDEKGDICGTLTIKHLLPTLPKVVTFFDGEIIGNNHDFVTDKWGATEEDDHAHWDRFKRDIYLRGNPVQAVSDSESDSDDESIYSSDSDGSNGTSSVCRSSKTRRDSGIPPNVVFMRLKERCFVNYDKERDLSGASFDGFYYIAVELNPAPDRPQLSLAKQSNATLNGSIETISKLDYFSWASSSNAVNPAKPSEARRHPVDREAILSSSAPSARSTFMTLSPSSSSASSSTVLVNETLSPIRPTRGSAFSRMSSYASVVRGELLGSNGTNTPSALYGGQDSTTSLPFASKADTAEERALHGDAVEQLAEVFSPSIEDFPFPLSPSSTTRPLPLLRDETPSPQPAFRPRSRSSSVRNLSAAASGGFRSGLSRSSSSNSRLRNGYRDTALSTNFYNSKTGYRGSWAHATMRGFYFTPPPVPTEEDADASPSSLASSGAPSNSPTDVDDAGSTYQELELFYVGDGHGALLEEYEEEQGGVDEWGNVRAIDEMEKIKKDFIRREFYAKPKGSASFTVL